MHDQTVAFGRDFCQTWKNMVPSIPCLFTKFLPCYIDPMSSNYTSNISYHLLNYFGTTDMLKALFVFQLNTVLRDVYCFHGLKMSVGWLRKLKQITTILSQVSWLYQVLQETTLQPLKRKRNIALHILFTVLSQDQGSLCLLGSFNSSCTQKVLGAVFISSHFPIFGSSQYSLSYSDIFSMFCYNL